MLADIVRRLADLLAEQLPDIADARRFLRAAGIEPASARLDDAQDCVAWWRAALETVTEEQVGRLLELARQEFPGLLQLLIVQDAFERWRPKGHQGSRGIEPVGPGPVAPPTPKAAEPSPAPSIADAAVITLRLDAAVPERVVVDRPFTIAVAVRWPSSPRLSEADLPVTRSDDTQVFWPSDQPFVRLRLMVSSAYCTVNDEPSRPFRLYRGHDSPIFYFSLTPTVTGPIDVRIELYQEDDLIGSARVNTTADRGERLAGVMNLTFPSQTVEAARMTAAAKMALAKALLGCPTVLDRQNRDAVVNDLPDEIRLGVSRSDSALLDVQNIIGLALNYEGGLDAFIAGVRLFEGNSLSMAKVDRVLGEIGWVGQPG
ncbi:MAG: hypothetical protein BWY52_02934 [Chloroflexi bacterium ADurb.Bin325]|nr:MAG: hypothetical protein BWY52_02934 [Chloroflexi bacterium ADurb.Bin325]